MNLTTSYGIKNVRQFPDQIGDSKVHRTNEPIQHKYLYEDMIHRSDFKDLKECFAAFYTWLF